ncbi:hypothetical protein GGR03_004598, partial [Aurantimonas endophytica]|nr:hypothetical protein [Aurantimonas endophytica]MBB4005496.1 hypothetical protein [Aurantimonas endophytica]
PGTLTEKVEKLAIQANVTRALFKKPLNLRH